MREEIKWKPHLNCAGGQQGLIFFENGYGASIVNGLGTYTSEGEYELAVMKGSEDDCEICYDTHITSDVIGHLSPEEVDETLVKIENLKAGEDDLQLDD